MLKLEGSPQALPGYKPFLGGLGIIKGYKLFRSALQRQLIEQVQQEMIWLAHAQYRPSDSIGSDLVRGELHVIKQIRR
jgi:hypothetical protein